MENFPGWDQKSTSTYLLSGDKSKKMRKIKLMSDPNVIAI